MDYSLLLGVHKVNSESTTAGVLDTDCGTYVVRLSFIRLHHRTRKPQIDYTVSAAWKFPSRGDCLQIAVTIAKLFACYY